MDDRPTHAWTLVYETPTGASWRLPLHVGDPGAAADAAGPRPSGHPHGWSGGDGPGIPSETWPRSPRSGLPMRHLLTLHLPEEYLRRGPGFPGVAIFQGDEERGDPPGLDPALGGAVLEDVLRSRPHPQLVSESVFFSGRRFALVWLTAAELAAGPTAPPPDTRLPEHRGRGDRTPWARPNAWDDPRARRDVWLVPRQDPNVGVPTRSADYRDPIDEVSGLPSPWAAADEFRFADHLGGTYLPIDRVPRLTPWFLQLGHASGAELGLSLTVGGRTTASGGILAVDLDTGEFDHVA